MQPNNPLSINTPKIKNFINILIKLLKIINFVKLAKGDILIAKNRKDDTIRQDKNRNDAILEHKQSIIHKTVKI